MFGNLKLATCHQSLIQKAAQLKKLLHHNSKLIKEAFTFVTFKKIDYILARVSDFRMSENVSILRSVYYRRVSQKKVASNPGDGLKYSIM